MVCENNDTPMEETVETCAVNDTPAEPCDQPEIPEDVSEEIAAEPEAPVEETAVPAEPVEAAEPTEAVEDPAAPAEPEIAWPSELEPRPEPVSVVQTPPAPAAPVQPAKKTTAAAKAAKKRKKPHILLRILLQFLSLLLSLVLFVVVIAGVLLMDLQHITSGDGIKQLFKAIVAPSHSVSTIVHPETPMKNTATGNRVVSLSSSDETVTIPGDFNVDDIPEDLLSGGATEENINGLVDWIYDQIQEANNGKMEFSKEQMQAFVENSTVSDFMAEKLTEYADDFINGTENATITTEEIMDLLEENEEALESELNITLTEEQKEKINTNVEKIVVEQDLSNTIREKVNATVSEVLENNTEALGGLELEDIQAALQLLGSGLPTYIMIGAAVVLLLLLCLLNFHNVPAGLTWASLSMINAGLILSVPILMLKYAAGSITQLVPISGAIMSLLVSFVDVFAPLHYGLLILGVALLVISIIWRIIRAAVRRRRMVTV